MDIALEKIWKILMEDNIQIPGIVSSDLICTMCKKIMIKPCNVPCGCRYCSNCLEKYLIDGDKFCLGESDYCKNEVISLCRNVRGDPPINIKISKLLVKCSLCEFQTELFKMSDHISLCDKRPLCCPYSSIGCLQDKICIGGLKDHFTQEDYSHSKLLMEFVDNSRNEIKLIKMDFMRLERENTIFKEELSNCQSNVNSKQEIILSLQELEKKSSVEMELMKQEIIGLKNENRRMDEKLNNVMDMVNSKQELAPLAVIDKPNAVQNQVTQVLNRTDKDSPVLNVQLTHPANANPNESPFWWCIDNWSSMLQHAKAGLSKLLCSGPFYSHKNGYKMLVRLYPNGCGNGEGVSVFVSVCIVKGEFDDMLKWPFKSGIQVEMINKQTGFCYASKMRRYCESPQSDAWKKPGAKDNIGIGFDNLISLVRLADIVSKYLDNKIWFKITTDYIG